MVVVVAMLLLVPPQLQPAAVAAEAFLLVALELPGPGTAQFCEVALGAPLQVAAILAVRVVAMAEQPSQVAPPLTGEEAVVAAEDLAALAQAELACMVGQEVQQIQVIQADFREAEAGGPLLAILALAAPAIV
jgi:hypothetical protein